MGLHPCEYRVATPAPQRFYCRHAEVHSKDNFVDAAVCKSCSARQRNCRAPRPVPSPEDLVPPGWGRRDAAISRWLRLGAPLPPLPAAKDAITICVTAFNRPKSLERLLKSVARHHSHVPVVVVDTGDETLSRPPRGVQYQKRGDLYGNLSAARNALVQLAETEFVWVLEDDFELSDATSLEKMLDVLVSDPEVGLAGGRLVEDGTTRSYACDIRRFRDTLEVTEPPLSRWASTRRGTLYRYCDMVFNFFLARRKTLLENPWDEDLPLHEHAAWFLTLRQQANWRVAIAPSAVAFHHQDRPNEKYKRARGRSRELQSVLKAKYGFSRVKHIQPDNCRDRPNILVLAVGHDNSSITAKQLFELGWNAGDADEEFGESVSVRNVNRRLLQTGEFALVDGYDALSALPQPWALKDPRFSRTLDRWLPLLMDYEPLLLWVQKDLEIVKASYRKRGEHIGNEHKVEQRLESCRRYFESWPWAKLTVRAEDIGQSAAIFDLRRLKR